MLSIYSDRGWFLKTKMPNLVLQNAKIFMVFSLFNIIKALMPKFSQHNAKKDGVFKVQFHNKNLAFKMPKWATKCLNWQHVAQYLLLKNWCFYSKYRVFSILTPIKKCQR